MRYGRNHRLSSSLREQIAGYRAGREFGLHLLPATAPLDGLIVDAGANCGDFTAVVRRLEPRSRVLAIEPIPGERERLERRFSNDGSVSVDGHALSDRAGSATLNITSESVHASLLPAREDTMSIYDGGTDVTERVDVATASLDQLVDEPVSLLKLDVQGHEIAALQGATRTLAQTRAVLLEVLFQSHYTGDATFGELHAFMQDAGFALCGLNVPYHFAGRVLWGDACYCAAGELS
ncbi:MAG TPA: FkbM family methyltransferase [Solirubrobacteraceae bacterium]|jgi:FkbM family methyltransferase|nr:FkbM family methyltransferase [Solirubrobacteraceae bacterium]